MAFSGLDETLFATYAPEKWSSMVHNLARMKGKDTLLALCDQAATTLTEELRGLARAASDEIPNISNQKRVDSQWVYWFRGPEEREGLAGFLKQTPLDQATIFNIATQDKHATLAVIIREAELWIGLRIAPGATVDRRNAASLLAKQWKREQLLELLAELPEGATLGPAEDTCPSDAINDELLQQQAELLGDKDPTWEIGHSITAADAIGLGTDVADHVGRWLGVLAPFYRYFAWSRDNDQIAAAKQIQEEKAQKRRQAASYQKGDKVRLTGGMFAGKLGVVESTGTKAQVKVRVGKMSIKVSGTDLIPA